VTTRAAARQPNLLDFLPEVVAERADRDADALVCLRDEVPQALEAVVHLAWWRQIDETGFRNSSGRYLYLVCRAGIRYERKGEGNDGDRGRPARLLAWDELAAMVGGDPRRAEVAAWVDSLPEPRWSVLTRPHELWPQPEQWHPSYIENDHARPGWPARIAAWTTVQAILTDAIGRLHV
jgi:hypothetical protein